MRPGDTVILYRLVASLLDDKEPTFVIEALSHTLKPYAYFASKKGTTVRVSDIGKLTKYSKKNGRFYIKWLDKIPDHNKALNDFKKEVTADFKAYVFKKQSDMQTMKDVMKKDITRLEFLEKLENAFYE